MRSLALVMMVAACDSGTTPMTDASSPDASDEADAPLDAAQCVADHTAYWTIPASTCTGARTCVDDHGRFWNAGKPFFPRGVYNGGIEYLQVLSNCPSTAACQATTPKDVNAYVDVLGKAGVNLIMDRSNLLPQEMLDAIHANTTVGIAHLLWTDPFTQANHDSIVSDIAAAIADPDVLIWFGPDEVDFNGLWDQAAGIRRLLRGSSTALDALLAGAYAPTDMNPYLPSTEPAHDSLGLPFEAAIYSPSGLAQGTNVYDVLMPETYVITSSTSQVGLGSMGTERIAALTTKAPVMPVLQLVGIAEQGLAQPSAGQVRAQIASALANGATGEFLYNFVSDKPSMLGRTGWYAPDAQDAWSALSDTHALEDALMPVMFSAATVSSGKQGSIEWRSWTLDSRQVTWIVNPTSSDGTFDLGAGNTRDFTTCAPITDATIDVPAYDVRVIETLM